MKFRKLLFCCVGLVIVGLMWCTWFEWVHPKGNYHYKVTVSVETPEGIYSGSTDGIVIVNPGALHWLIHHNSTVKTYGVVLMDLGAHGRLNVIVNNPDIMIYEMFPWAGDRNRNAPTAAEVSYYNALRGSTYIPASKIASFFAFTKSDPKSVRRIVDGQNLAKFFGDGFRLLDVKIELNPDIARK